MNDKYSLFCNSVLQLLFRNSELVRFNLEGLSLDLDLGPVNINILRCRNSEGDVLVMRCYKVVGCDPKYSNSRDHIVNEITSLVRAYNQNQ